ncbi:hypothetical protein DICPUDRAFT_99209 [Dictyostelium purpureum]|uniref:Sugar phosphate transporter domain-containing protein n=1 Tax=Dictyostelium purpureum TaxID=5786 RepID=F0ZX74_DICPU|nr:uncharacterized protein DICPUDRAFT_99209 [Dictyostelium purpureum]EGC31447.1 hypothetical protein DICPUDRAFT_99209 [Dictyostelium purpureum]|eukprot:XP_003292016.1 hypothetical protein DICPUDRAFT_99209 [Dictyostelium purpureum]
MHRINHDYSVVDEEVGGGSGNNNINSNSNSNNNNNNNTNDDPVSPLIENISNSSINNSNNNNGSNSSMGEKKVKLNINETNNQNNSNNIIEKKKSHLIISTIWVIVWITLNMGLFFGNKYLDNYLQPNFQYPVLIILTGTFATFLGSFTAVFIFKISEFPVEALKQHKLLLFLVSVFQAFTYVLENYSIAGLSISLNQIIKSTGPVFIILIGYILYRETYSIQIILSTLILILGVSLSVYHNPDFKITPSLYALGSIIFAAVQTLLIAKLLKDPKLNTLSIVVTTSFPSAITCLILFFITGEYKELHSYTGSATEPTIIVILLAIAACFYNLSHFYIVEYTSALYYVIIGNIKVILLIIVSFFVFKTNTEFTTVNIIGMVITIIGFLIYNYFKYYEKLGKKPPVFKVFSSLSPKFKYSQIEDLSKPSARKEDIFSIKSSGENYDIDDDDDEDNNFLNNNNYNFKNNSDDTL